MEVRKKLNLSTLKRTNGFLWGGELHLQECNKNCCTAEDWNLSSLYCPASRMVVHHRSWKILEPDCLALISSFSTWFWISLLIALYLSFFICKMQEWLQNMDHQFHMHNYKTPNFSKLKTLSFEHTYLVTRTDLSLFSNVMWAFVNFSGEMLMCLIWNAALALSVGIT